MQYKSFQGIKKKLRQGTLDSKQYGTKVYGSSSIEDNDNDI